MPTERKPLASTAAKAKAFLEAFRRTANVTKSAKAAGIGVRTHYRWLDESESYKAAFEKAKPIAARFLLDRTIEGCTDGWEEPVFYQGEPIRERKYAPDGKTVIGYGKALTIRRFDLGGRQFLLRGLMPDVFGAKVEIGGKDGGPVSTRLEVVFVNAKPAETPTA